MKSVSVVHINAAGSGGAYVAADRIAKAIEKYHGLDCKHWIFEYEADIPNRWADSFWKKWKAIGLHALEKLDFLRFEKSKAVRFAFSHGKTGISVVDWGVIQRADIIHLHWINKGFISLNGLSKLLALGKPIFWTCHDLWPFTGGCYHPRGCDYFTKNCGNCQYLKNPNDTDLSFRVFGQKSELLASPNLHFIAPSSWLKNQAMTRGELHLKHPIRVIANPIDVDFFSPMSASSLDTLKESWQIPKSKRVLLFISANLSNPKKGFAEFVELANQLEYQQPNQWFSIIVGDRGPEVLSLDMEHVMVGLLKSPEQIKAMYNLADVYVTTSHEENLPTTIIEAQSVGLPVAAFAVGGIPEMITAELGYCGALLDLKSMENWLVSWNELEESEKQQLSRLNREFAIRNYSEKIVAQQYVEAYGSDR